MNERINSRKHGFESSQAQRMSEAFMAVKGNAAPCAENVRSL